MDEERDQAVFKMERGDESIVREAITDDNFLLGRERGSCADTARHCAATFPKRREMQYGGNGELAGTTTGSVRYYFSVDPCKKRSA